MTIQKELPPLMGVMEIPVCGWQIARLRTEFAMLRAGKRTERNVVDMMYREISFSVLRRMSGRNKSNKHKSGKAEWTN